MGRRFGCWKVLVVLGVVGLVPNFCHLVHLGGAPGRVAPVVAASVPVCLEVWVRLRSYRGCPVLAAGGGYRLGIYCFPRGCPGQALRSNGALVIAGPFLGHAYISDRPVPLGRWVHLAGLAGGSGAGPADTAPALAPAATTSAAAPAATASAATPATTASAAAPAYTAPAPPSAAAPPRRWAGVAIDGVDATAGRFAGWTDPLPLGDDPWQAGCAGGPGSPDGQIGARRWSRGWLSLAQLAAGRGTPRRLAPLAALPDAGASRSPGANGGAGAITPRGWAILASGLLLAAAMAAAGLALRRAGGRRAGEALSLASTIAGAARSRTDE